MAAAPSSSSHAAAGASSELRRFNVHTSSFLREITIHGPEDYVGKIGHGASGSIVLHSASQPERVAGAVHYQRERATIELHAGDPADGGSGAQIEVSDDSHGAQYNLNLGACPLVFYRQGYKTRSRFCLVDTARHTLLAQFEPGSGRDHVLDVYDSDPQLEILVLLLAAMVAVRVQRASEGPSLWTMEREIEAARQRNAIYGAYTAPAQVNEPWPSAKELAG